MRVTVTLRYRDRTYTFVPDGCDYDAPGDALFMWTDGNFGCDCNKSLFIQRQCNEDFPDLECGEDVTLVALTAEDGTVLYPESDAATFARDAQGMWTWDSAAQPQSQQIPVVITQRPSGIYIVTDA